MSQKTRDVAALSQHHDLQSFPGLLSHSSSADCHDGQSNNPECLHNSVQILLQKKFLEGKPCPRKVTHSWIFLILFLFCWTAVNQSWIFLKLCTHFTCDMLRSSVGLAWEWRSFEKLAPCALRRSGKLESWPVFPSYCSSPRPGFWNLLGELCVCCDWKQLHKSIWAQKALLVASASP